MSQSALVHCDRPPKRGQATHPSLLVTPDMPGLRERTRRWMEKDAEAAQLTG